MRFTTLADWLGWQQTLHPEKIALGLERIRAVWSRLGPPRLPCPVLTIGGTNGKGSCVALAEAVYRAAGYRTGAYSSPHLLRYNERVRIDGQEVSDAALCAAFSRVDAARGDIALTYFEFGTLAALDLFVRSTLDLVILEVGLGGRLDAVNLIDADVAIVTTIGRDHTAWLGSDLASIAVEKAGIFRAGRPAVIGQRDAPAALRGHAESLGCQIQQLGRELDWDDGDAPGAWRWHGPGGRLIMLPPLLLRGRFQYDNAAAVIMAVANLEGRLPVPVNALRQGLQRAALGGRFQVRSGTPTWILDVAHNPDAARALATNLERARPPRRVHAVLAVLGDKEPSAIVDPLRPLVDVWHLTQTSDPRAMPVSDLAAALAGGHPNLLQHHYPTMQSALAEAASCARQERGTILVLGSFTAVEAALRLLAAEGASWTGSPGLGAVI